MTETHRLLIALSSITLYVLWVAVIFYKCNKKRCATNVATDKKIVRTLILAIVKTKP